MPDDITAVPTVAAMLRTQSLLELQALRCRSAEAVPAPKGCGPIAQQLIPIIEYSAALLTEAHEHTIASPASHHRDLFGLHGQLLSSSMAFTALHVEVRLEQIEECCGHAESDLMFTGAVAVGLRAVSTDVALAAMREERRQRRR